MDPSGRSERQGRDTYLAIMFCLVLGVPLFVFFNVLTGGLFVLLLVLSACVGILGAFNYLLWGRSFTHEVAGEREEQEVRERMQLENGTFDEHPNRRPPRFL